MPKTEFAENELEASLRRAFVDGGADFIIFDGQTLRNNFLRAGLNYAIEKGWIYKSKPIKEEQYTAETYRLTDKGKNIFGLKNKLYYSNKKLK